MKRNNYIRILTFIVAVITVCVLALPTFAAYPKADGYVADEAGVLAQSTIRQINKTNETLKKDAGLTIAVCAVKTTGDVSIADYARGLYTEWKLGEGVLILVAAEDENYYIVQSTGIENQLTNADIEAIRDGYLEDDFAAGNIDSGVLKAFSKLTSELEDGIEAPVADDTPTDDTNENDNKEENEGTTAGKVIVTILKVILYIVLFALAAFVILFVVAMFNDDAAALLQRYVFRRGKYNPAQQTYYDERLYGNGNRRPQQQRPQPRPQNPGQRRNPNQMYNADGTPRKPQNSGNRNNRDGYGY